MNEWRAQIDRDWASFGERLKLYRLAGDDVVEYIAGFEPDGRPIIERTPPGVSPGFTGLALPPGALQAVAELLKPGPSQGETARLNEALAVERRRVDAILERAQVNPL